MQAKGQELRTYRDELNIARLSLISLQREVKPGQTKWESRIERDDRAYHVECIAPEGIPHGLDSDVIVAVQTLFAEQGLPENNIIVTTPYGLLKTAGLQPNGRNYSNLRESLRRLYLTSYVIRDGWFDLKGKKWRFTGKTFRMVDDIVFRDTEELSGNVTLDADGALRIRLNPQVADSIRAGYIRLADHKILRKLDQPTARALYRLLDAHRYNPENIQERVQQLEFNLMEWAEHCRIVSERPEIIRRNLDRMHKELINTGFLSDVQYTGRGKQQTITYTFGAAARDADPYLVQLLLDVRVVRPMAEKLAREYPERIEDGLALARHLSATSKTRNFSGFVVDVIRKYDEYAKPASFVPPQALEAVRSQHKAREVRAENNAETQLEQEEAQYRSLPVQYQAEHTVNHLKVYFSKPPLDTRTCDRIRAAILAGVDGWAMQRAVVQAMFSHQDKRAALMTFLDESAPST